MRFDFREKIPRVDSAGVIDGFFGSTCFTRGDANLLQRGIRGLLRRSLLVVGVDSERWAMKCLYFFRSSRNLWPVGHTRSFRRKMKSYCVYKFINKIQNVTSHTKYTLRRREFYLIGRKYFRFHDSFLKPHIYDVISSLKCSNI